MTSNEWPFDQPRNCAVFTNHSIVFGDEEILNVFHDLSDHGWQFLNCKPPTTNDVALVLLEEIVARDDTVLEVADLPPGWAAKRPMPGAPWERFRNPRK
jgi:hypothetical protein